MTKLDNTDTKIKGTNANINYVSSHVYPECSSGLRIAFENSAYCPNCGFTGLYVQNALMKGKYKIGVNLGRPEGDWLVKQ